METPPRPIEILTLNAGSSSLKFAVHRLEKTEVRILSGACEGIGSRHGQFHVRDQAGRPLIQQAGTPASHAAAAQLVLKWLRRAPGHENWRGIGHRIVHGGLRYGHPAEVTPAMTEELSRIGRLDPEHLGPELTALQAAAQAFPRLPQIACFDTAFHRRMPRVAQMHPLPRKWFKKGLVRFGFHGLACESVLEDLRREGRPGEASGRIILAHLGSGASMTAVRGGVGIDTTMGFMPNGGLMMATRPGDLSPGVLLDLMLEQKLSAREVNKMVNLHSGLLGVSGLSGDMRELLAAAPTHAGAAEAIDLFCYTARKHLGALAAVLGGLDTLVFSGGIGENAPAVRRRLCQNLEFLGLRLDQQKNRRNAALISAPRSAVAVRVIHADEELVIARNVGRWLRPRQGAA